MLVCQPVRARRGLSAGGPCGAGPSTFDAAGDVEEALVVHKAQVPAVQPAFLIEDLRGLFLFLQVAHEDVPAPHADLPDAVTGLLVQHVFTATCDFAAAAGEWKEGN